MIHGASRIACGVSRSGPRQASGSGSTSAMAPAPGTVRDVSSGQLRVKINLQLRQMTGHAQSAAVLSAHGARTVTHVRQRCSMNSLAVDGRRPSGAGRR